MVMVAIDVFWGVVFLILLQLIRTLLVYQIFYTSRVVYGISWVKGTPPKLAMASPISIDPMSPMAT